MGKYLVAACLLPAVILASGCWVSKADGERMQAAADARDRRIGELENQNRQIREEAVQRIAELEDVLERATQLLKRNSADVGAQVQQMEQQIAGLEGQIAELRHELEKLEAARAARGASAPQVLDPSEIPADKEAHYAAAYQAYETNAHEKARALFRAYLERYAGDAKAGTAQYWIGSSYLQQDKPATALGEYRKVITDHAKSNAVDVALYGMADAFFRLRACGDAKTAIKALLDRKPKKSLADRAKALGKKIDAAGKSGCSS